MNEAWSLQRRRKQGVMMKRRAKLIARARKRKLSRLADDKTIKKRAKKAAREILFKKLTSGKTKSQLASKQAVIEIDKRIDKNPAKIAKLAKKIYAKIRKKEVERFKNMKRNS